jgi:hypothetical protein
LLVLVVFISFSVCSGDSFVKRVDAYLRRQLGKGIPNLFRDVYPLYSDSAKAAVMERLVDQYLEHLPAHGRYAPDEEQGWFS